MTASKHMNDEENFILLLALLFCPKSEELYEASNKNNLLIGPFFTYYMNDS